MAFKSMLRRRGIRVVSITEQADDTPTGKLLEAIIESVDEFYSENLALEVTRGMREAASRGFWVSPEPPYGYRKVYVQDGVKKRPRLEPDPPADAVVRRIFDMVLHGKEHPGRYQDPQRRGHPHGQGQEVAQDHRPHHAGERGVHRRPGMGYHCQGRGSAGAGGEGLPRHRLQEGVPQGQENAGVPSAQRAPTPGGSPAPTCSVVWSSARPAARPSPHRRRRAGSTPTTSAIHYSKKGRGTCKTPRLNAKSFEKLIVEQIRENVLTEGNIRDLVKLVDEEMDGVAREQRLRLKSIDDEA